MRRVRVSHYSLKRRQISALYLRGIQDLSIKDCPAILEEAFAAITHIQALTHSKCKGGIE